MKTAGENKSVRHRHLGQLQLYNTDGTYYKKGNAICKNCLVKVRYMSNTTNMDNHLIHHRPDLVLEKTTNATTSISKSTFQKDGVKQNINS